MTITGEKPVFSSTAFAVSQFTLFPKRRLADIFELLIESVYEVSLLQFRKLNKYLYLVEKLQGVTAIELVKICIRSFKGFNGIMLTENTVLS